MNFMRFLVLLTFILYETRCAESFKHLKFLKTLLTSKILAPEQANFDEVEYTVNKCESIGNCDDGPIDELNPQPYSTNGDSGLNENEDKEIISSENTEDFPVDNSEINSENPEKENENVYEKDKNTEWLLGENINVNQPSELTTMTSTLASVPETVTTSTPDRKNHLNTIKDKIQNKINAIKSKLQLINRKIKPVLEIIPNDSVEVYEENHSTSNTGSPTISEAKPFTTKEPVIISESSPIYTDESITREPATITIKPVYIEESIITENPITVEPNHVQVNVETQGPIVNIVPTQNNTALPENKIYVSPYALWVNDCPPLHQQVNYQPNFQYATNPLLTKQWTLANTPYNWPMYQNQQNIKFGISQPISTGIPIQWLNSYYNNLKPIYPNPIPSSVSQVNKQTALFEPAVSVSGVMSTASPNNLIVPTNGLSPLSYNTYVDSPLEFNYAPFRQLAYQNQRLNYGTEQVENNFRVGIKQPIVSEQVNQRINFEQANAKPQQYAENVPSYSAETSGSIVSSSGIPYSSLSTTRPIDDITPTDAPSPISTNTNFDRPLEFNYTPLRQPTYQNQKFNYGVEQAVNNFKVDANQLIVPEQANQWNNFEQASSKPQQYAENIPTYITDISRSDMPYRTVVPSSDVKYSTVRPIDVYSSDVPDPIPANSYVAKPLTNAGYRPQQQFKYQNQIPNIGTLNREVNNFKVGYNQPVNSEQTNQRIYFEQINSNHQRPGSVFPNLNIAYTSPSTVRLVDVTASTYTPSVVPTNTYVDKSVEFNNTASKQLDRQNQRLNIEAEQVINNFRTGVNKPIIPERANQWIYFNQANSNPLNPNPIASSIPQASRPTVPFKPIVPTSNAEYSSSSTVRPLDIFVSTNPPNPISANMYTDQRLAFNNAPFKELGYSNQRFNYGGEQVVKNFEVNANQPIVPERVNQKINLEQINSKSQPFLENIQSYVVKTSGSSVPSSGVVYPSTSTGQPIAVYPTDTPYPIPVNTYNPRPTIVGYKPQNQPKFSSQKTNIGMVNTEINDDKVGANRPTNSEQAIPSYVPEIPIQDVPSVPVSPSSNVAYSTPVEQLGPIQYPITYDTVPSAEQPIMEENLNMYSTSAIPMLNNDEQSSYQLRGDMTFQDSSDLKDQQDGIAYTLKERRHTGSNYDKKPFAQKEDTKKSVSLSEIRLEAPATKPTESLTSSTVKLDAPDTKVSTSSNFENVKSYSEVEIVDVKTA